MARVQGSLEYLIIISVVLAVTAIVTLIVVNSFGSQETHYLYNTCVTAAKTCRTTLISDSNAQCSFCDTSCNFTNGTEIFPNATQCCKQGNGSGIYDGSFGCKLSCFDGTPYGQCSGDQPKYCTGAGTLVDDCETCDCPPLHACNHTSKKCYPGCDDDTPYGKCSATKPLYCDSGNLVPRCDLPEDCGCPSGQQCNTTSKECYVPKCADLTPSGQCSSTRPLYCVCDSSGLCNLVPKCSTPESCPCPANTCCFGNDCEAACLPSCTRYGQCVTGNPPKLCRDGRLVDYCDTCGCSSGYECAYLPGNQSCWPMCGDKVLESGEACDPTASGNSCTCRPDCRCTQALDVVLARGDYIDVINYNAALTYLCPPVPAEALRTSKLAWAGDKRVKAADADSDGETEVIVAPYSMKNITIYDRSGGALIQSKYFINNLPNTYDFAVIDWERDGAQNLAILRCVPSGGCGVGIFGNITHMANGYSLEPTAMYMPQVDNHAYNRLQAFYLDGRPALMLSRTGDNNNCWVAILKAPDKPPYNLYTATPTYLTNFYTASDERKCDDFDVVDWDGDGIRRELVVLTRKSCAACATEQNDIWIYNISRMSTTGKEFKLDTISVPGGNYTWLDAREDHAEEMYVEDMDGDGKDEIVVVDVADGFSSTAYSNKCGNILGTKIDSLGTCGAANSCCERYLDIGGSCAGHITDLTGFNIGTGFGPKVA